MGLQFYALDHSNKPVYVEGFNLLDEDHPCGWIASYGWNRGNATAMCALLEFGDSTSGSVDIPTARRAVMRARALFDSIAPNYTREEEWSYGSPRTGSDGVIELRPLRAFTGGLTVEDLWTRLKTFAAYVESAAKAGAIRIQWS